MGARKTLSRTLDWNLDGPLEATELSIESVYVAFTNANIIQAIL